MSNNWNDDRTAKLVALVASANGGEVSQELVKAAAEDLGVTPRSAGAKLRKLDYEVEKASSAGRTKWPEEQEAGLNQFLNENEGNMTYAEIAAAFSGGQYTSKMVQGKILSMEMTDYVKPTPKVEVARTYTPDQEATFIAMAQEGASIEDISEALDKTIASVRGKGLSLSRQVEGFVMPVQARSHAKDRTDALTELGNKIVEMTVAEIAESTGKTERGVKTALTRRKLASSDYDGAKKAAKRDAKAND